MSAVLPTTQFRLGFRTEDYRTSVAPFDPALIDVGRIHRPGATYVVLRHAETGEHYARPMHAVVPQLVRAFPIL